MTPHPRLRTVAIYLLVTGAGTPGIAYAQAYPAKTIRMVVPFAAGGNTDIIARIVAPEMGRLFGQQIVIDNRGGAGSIIGTDRKGTRLNSSHIPLSRMQSSA